MNNKAKWCIVSKRLLFRSVAVVLLLSIALSSAYAGKSETLEVTITGFSLLYQMCMEALGQKPSLTREWIENNQAMIQLTDTCFCMVTTEEQSDFSNITEVLHTSAPESEADLLEMRCSMVSTIMTFDPALNADTVTNLVMNILPQRGEYTSENCQYKYVNSYNIHMLYIYPKN